MRALSLPVFILTSYAALAAFGLGNGWLFLAAALLSLTLAVCALARLRPPMPAEIDRRIEAASGLQHRPLATLSDSLAAGDPALWRLHQTRMAAALQTARAGWPSPFASAADPFSLRALVLLLLVTGLARFGPGPLAAGFALPAWPFAGPEVDAWITPPAYTGQAPALLTTGPVTALDRSQISVIESGATAAIKYAGQKLPSSTLGDDGKRADGLLTASGSLTIGPWWHRLARWNITVIPPASPAITLAPASIRNGALALSWTATDPYGLSSLSVSLHPAGFPAPLPESADLPTGTGPVTAALDITDSPYAGMNVTLRLHAQNLAGRSAQSNAQQINLPPALFHDPTAMLLSILRRNLALAPARATLLAGQLLHVARRPPSAISYAADLQLAALATGLANRTTPAQSGVDRLLTLIRQIEQGPDYLPAQQLAQASQNLLRALAHGPPNPAGLSRLLAAMQQALAAHLAALSPTPSGQQPPQNFDPSALNRLAQQIAADEQAGRTAQAQAELQELAQALQALQNARPMSAAQAAQAQAANAASQQLSQLIQSQASLLNQTAQGTASAAAQGKLRNSLAGLQAQLGKAGIQNLPGLGPAGQNMQNAQNALAKQDNATAQSAETSAVQNLQKAAAALQQAAQPSLQIGQLPGEIQNNPGPNGGDDFNNNPLSLPGENPADIIEQEIIQRDANPALPPATHEYLHRLLAPELAP